MIEMKVITDGTEQLINLLANDTPLQLLWWTSFLVSSLTFQTAFGAEPLASISRPFHLYLPFLNTTTQIILRIQAQINI